MTEKQEPKINFTEVVEAFDEDTKKEISNLIEEIRKLFKKINLEKKIETNKELIELVKGYIGKHIILLLKTAIEDLESKASQNTKKINSEDGENKTEENYILIESTEIDGITYQKIQKGNKEAYIKLGKDDDEDNIIFFNKVDRIRELNGKIFYIANKENKQGYCELGKENDAVFVFFYVRSLKERYGELWHIGGKGDRNSIQETFLRIGEKNPEENMINGKIHKDELKKSIFGKLYFKYGEWRKYEEGKEIFKHGKKKYIN